MWPGWLGETTKKKHVVLIIFFSGRECHVGIQGIGIRNGKLLSGNDGERLAKIPRLGFFPLLSTTSVAHDTIVGR